MELKHNSLVKKTFCVQRYMKESTTDFREKSASVKSFPYFLSP